MAASGSILLQDLNRDILGNITSRLDGPNLAATSCACKDLRDTARDGDLWRRLCHSLWPSTASPESSPLISDHTAFYKQSLPTVFYNGGGSRQIHSDKESSPSPSAGPEDFASMVDIYFKKKCVFSAVSVMLPDALTGDGEKWFSSCPFKWDVNVSRVSDSPAVNNTKRGSLLEEDLRLSWVVMDIKKGKTVNLSSWDPVSVERSWAFNGDYRAQFGCVVENGGVWRCVINARFRVAGDGEGLEVKEISLHIEDLNGAHVNGRRGLMVLDQAVGCARTMSRVKVVRGFRDYERRKEELMKKKEIKEMAALGFFVLVEVFVFVLLLYVFMRRLYF